MKGANDMSLTEGMTPADLAAVTGNNEGFGGNGAWWIIILFLFIFCGWGNNGWGNNGSGAAENYALASDFATLQRQIDSTTSSLERKLDGVNNGLCDGFYAQNTTALQGFAGVNQNMSTGFQTAELSRANQQAALMQQLNNMQMQQSNCCCETREAIQGVNYNLATQSCDTRNTIQSTTRDIIDNQNSNARAILDALTAQRLEAKDEKIAEQNQQLFAAQLAASQAAQTNDIRNYVSGQLAYYNPRAVPAFNVPAPFQYSGCGSGCNC